MNRMKITAGLSSPEAYPRLVQAGADELFAGFIPWEWLEKYTNLTPLNRREVLLHGIQIDTLDEMHLLAEQVEKYGAPVSLTFNSISYLPEQYPVIAELLFQLSQLEFRDWILADPGLILYLKNQDINGRIHLSGEAGCFNPDAFRLFSRMGVHRYIFPRKMTPEEMAACISAVPGAEYEAFVLNERCHYSGAFCSSLHCDELDHLCHVPFRPVGPDCRIREEDDPYPADHFGAGGCALCALPLLKQAGVTHLKVVGRGAHVECIERDVALLRRALDLDGAAPEALRREILGGACSRNCYYPV